MSVDRTPLIAQVKDDLIQDDFEGECAVGVFGSKGTAILVNNVEVGT